LVFSRPKHAEYFLVDVSADTPRSIDVSGLPPKESSSDVQQPTLDEVLQVSQSQQLWNQAYDALAGDDDNAKLVTAYVKVLEEVLGAKKGDSANGENAHLEDPAQRQQLMTKLVEQGRSKVSRSNKVMTRIADFSDAILSLKPLVDLVTSVPQAAPAALPWAGVCVGLQVR
jgi:hypothetical protein